MTHLSSKLLIGASLVAILLVGPSAYAMDSADPELPGGTCVAATEYSGDRDGLVFYYRENLTRRVCEADSMAPFLSRLFGFRVKPGAIFLAGVDWSYRNDHPKPSPNPSSY